MTRFVYREAGRIVVGDLMRQVDEQKRRSVFYHYRAASVFVGDIASPIHDLEGKYIGDRVDRDVVRIEWQPVEPGKSFSMVYHPKAVIEVAAIPGVDVTELLSHEDYQDEI